MADKFPGLFYLERFRNKGTRTYSRHSQFTAAENEFRPDADHDGFEIAAFSIPKDQVKVYLANPPAALADMYLGAEHLLFCIHPQVLTNCPNDPYVRKTLALSSGRSSIHVLPSSSTRTLLVESQEIPHALKVHFPFQVSRYTRKMRAEVIAQAINVSCELEAGIQQMDDQFAFLREVIGIAHKNLDPAAARGENWGYLIRDMIPYPYKTENAPLIPGFALYGEDYFDPSLPPLMFDLIGSRDPVDYLLSNIMLPIIHHWVACFSQFGFLLEPHAQNVLLALHEDRNVSQIVHRDLSVGIDMRRRRDLGLPTDHFNDYNRLEQSAFHSITYDRFMGGHFFDRLVAACQIRYPGIAKEAFTTPCRDAFARLLPDYAAYFPKTVWYFSEERDRFNKPYYQDTGALPEWRP